ncbi:E3 ubiquitin-protein ligase RBBP6 [Gossypium australe]|uniref:E3 ubiquitin-protein ligase RBBP6 n=1 Tax=Gossypium australe TaxID=47621 RepID=A0A5B6VLE2_9ROSI|nr:E3 ubiquitin-protein ligase RBBP6 [Gossypium australe]
MLLPFDEFDVILGMDWLTLHDAVLVLNRQNKQSHQYDFCFVSSENHLKRLELVPIVSDFADFFLEELSRLPPIKEVEFAIDLVPKTSPILVAPYRIAPIKLKDLKAQL